MEQMPDYRFFESLNLGVYKNEITSGNTHLCRLERKHIQEHPLNQLKKNGTNNCKAINNESKLNHN